MTERERARALQGQRAGFVSRIAAAAIDVSIVFAIYLVALIAWGLALALATEKSFELPTPPVWFSGTALIALLVVGLAILWSASGRTLGDSAVGLRVVTEQGARVSFVRALGRALVLAFVPFVSMGWILVSRTSRPTPP